MQIVGCRKLLLQGLELTDGESCLAGSKAAGLGRRRAFVGALCMVSRRAWRDLFFSVYCSLGSFAWYDIPEASDDEERGIGIENITASRIKQ